MTKSLRGNLKFLFMVKKRLFDWGWVVALVLLVVVLLVWWFVFFGEARCESWECFNEHLAGCSRVEFVGDSDMIYEYSVEGRSGSECEVGVKLLQGQLNNQESARLEGLEMTCMLPMGVVVVPESDIRRCHGLLKEGLQDMVIERLHGYIVQNLGEINSDVMDVS